jgi:hypothetical protein
MASAIGNKSASQWRKRNNESDQLAKAKASAAWRGEK